MKLTITNSDGSISPASGVKGQQILAKLAEYENMTDCGHCVYFDNEFKTCDRAGHVESDGFCKWGERVGE